MITHYHIITYDHIIKKINKCTGLSNDDCCVKQTKNMAPSLPSPSPPPKKKNRTQKIKKTKQKAKQKEHACLYFLQK